MRLALVLALAACSVTDTAQLPPPAPGTLTLDVEPLEPGETSVHTVTGATPGSWVYLGASTRPPGAGPCLPSAGGLCLDLVSPTLLGTLRADASGEARFLLLTPSTLPQGLDVTLQAVAIQGPGGRDSASSPPVTTTLDGDQDGDGFAASEDCDDDDASVFPGADEVCNGIDDDCDPLTDELGEVTVNGVAFPTLVSAIAAAPTGGEIRLCGGTHRLDDVDLTRAVSFIGDGPEYAQIRPVSDHILTATADFTARHVRFTDGDSSLGRHAVRLLCNGACYDHVLEDVIFEDNEAGGLYAVTDTLTITDSVFRDNSGGRALHTARGAITLERVSLTDNTAGAIRVEGGEVAIIDSDVLRNSASSGGGASVDHILRSIRTNWGFGPGEDNVPNDVRVTANGGPFEYGFFGDDETFDCYEDASDGPVGCQ